MSVMASRKLTALTVIPALVLALAACGGGDTGDATPDTPPRATVDRDDASGDTSDPADSDRTGPTAPTTPGATDVVPVALLAAPTPAAPGHKQIVGECESTDDTSLRSAFAFAIPDTWEVAGQTSGGSGGTLDQSLQVRFDTPDGDVWLSFEQDNRDGEGTIMDGDLPWESFDYQVDSSATATTRVEFTETFDVTVGDQHVTVHVADQAQAPDYLTETRHTARIDVADIISYAGPADGLRRVSYVVSVEHDKDGVALTDDVIGALLASVSLPECAWDDVVLFEEMVHGVDLNGDGVIATVADLIAE